MEKFDPKELQRLYRAPKDSHKGQNGKLLVIGGSKLFHAASLWSLTVASRIVDMVFYSSVPENNEMVSRLKEEFRNGIVVPRGKVEHYIEEADAIVIGPGLPRDEGVEEGDDDTKELTERLLRKYPEKKWVVDGGSLQVIDPGVLPKTSIVTPHEKEFLKLFGKEAGEESAFSMAKKFGITVLLKGPVDVVCDSTRCIEIEGGNEGMTKGGTGDVLAGLVGALYCKNEAFLSAGAAAYIHKKAGESLYKKVGPYFNATDLANEIPNTIKSLLTQ